MVNRKNVSLDTIMSRLVHEFGLGIYLPGVSASTTDQIVDARLVLPGVSPSYFRGAKVRVAASNSQNNNQIRQVADYDNLTGTITVIPQYSDVISAGSNVEIWRLYDPADAYFDIDSAMRTTPIEAILPLDELIADDPVHFIAGQEMIFVIDLRYADAYISGSVALSTPFGSIGVRGFVGTENLSSCRVVMKYTPAFTGYASVNVSNGTSANITVRVIKPYGNRLTMFNYPTASRTDIVQIYEDTAYDSVHLYENVYAIPEHDGRDTVTDYSIQDFDTIVLKRPQKGLLSARVVMADASITALDYFSTTQKQFYIQEDLLLGKTAMNVFSRLKSLAGTETLNTGWIDMQLQRAADMVARETRDQNMRIRGHTKTDRGYAYTLGQTYLPDISV